MILIGFKMFKSQSKKERKERLEKLRNVVIYLSIWGAFPTSPSQNKVGNKNCGYNALWNGNFNS
jgi:hypothetical protein